MKGILPGIIAGFIFLAFAGPGMNGMVGGMIGAGDTPLVGFHPRYHQRGRAGVYMGIEKLTVIVGGLIRWIIGGNIIQPVISGGDVLPNGFFGHIIYGQTLA